MPSNDSALMGRFSPLLDPAHEFPATEDRHLDTGSIGTERIGLLAIGAIIVVLLSMAVSVQIGVSNVGLADLIRVAGTRLGLDIEPLRPMRESLIWDLRLPRVLAAALVGAGLAVCGATLQAITGNSLADPYLLGISGGASTGAVCVVILGLGGGMALGTGAFIGAIFVLGVLLVLLRRGGTGPLKLVLTGVIVGQFFSAVTSFVVMAAGDAETTRGITYWLLGSLTTARWTSVLLLAVLTVIGTLTIWFNAHVLDAISFGSDTAQSMGINVERMRLILLVTCALMTAIAVSTVGAIGFIGLIVPHAVRMLSGPLHRYLIPFSALAGGVLLIWTDILARTLLAPQEIPVGVFTALIGVPLFMLVMRKRGEL